MARAGTRDATSETMKTTTTYLDAVISHLVTTLCYVIVALALALALLGAAPARASVGCLGSDSEACRWTTADTALQLTFVAVDTVDWMQTSRFLRDPALSYLHEGNPILGVKPSRLKLDAYFAAHMAADWLVAAALPRPYREIWQSGSIALELVVVRHNVTMMAGVKLALP